MQSDSNWLHALALRQPALAACLTGTGSLTARLTETGHAFAVEIRHQGSAPATATEAAALDVPPGTALQAREVALTLDGTPVVVARSLCRHGCPVWAPVLDRGTRSLGLTLFDKDSPVTVQPHVFWLAGPGDPLHALAASGQQGLAPCPARSALFLRDGATLQVAELFLPALENFL